MQSERLKKLKLDCGLPHLLYSFFECVNTFYCFVFEMGHRKRRNMEMKERNVENMEKNQLEYVWCHMPKIGHGAWVEDVWKSEAL